MSTGGTRLPSQDRPQHLDARRRPDHHDGEAGLAAGLDRFSSAWLAVAGQYARVQPVAATVSEPDCRREFLFCLLGGHGVTYELARSAADVLAARGVFGDCGRHGPRLERWLSDLLSRPWYEPRRLDGSGRRYRYPRRKAALLRRADDWLLAQAPTGLLAALEEIHDERSRRQWLCHCPGVGPKTASWLLRNIGLGNGLAIIDVHLLRALQSTGRAGSAALPGGYDELEQAFLKWSDDLGAPPAVFDLFLWEYGRGDLGLDLT